MKTKYTLFLLFLASFLLAGCKQEKAEEAEKENIYQVYYLNRDNTHIKALDYEVDIPAAETQKLAMALLEQMAQQVEVGYQPAVWNFSIKECEIQEGKAALNVSEEYKMLEPVREVLTRAAIVKTLTQLNGIEFVTMQVNGENLLDSLGNTIGVMSADSFIDNTGEDMKKYEQTTLGLYFTNADGDKLIKVNRTLRYNTNISLEKLVVEQLIAGPVEQKNVDSEFAVYPTLNPATRIISVNVKDSICYVNLNSSFLTTVNNASADAVIYSLVNSLIELPSVYKVQIAVEGKMKIDYREKYNFSAPFEANYDIVQTIENIDGE